jgi:hypothetical protein
MNKFIYVVGFGILFLSACSNLEKANQSKEVVKETQKEEDVKKQSIVNVSVGDASQRKSDPFQIVDAKIEGNFLLIKIQYGGGCKQHTFDFVGAPMVALSEPPIRQVSIIHFADNDMCKALVYDDLKVDVSSFIDTKKKGAKIYLTLPNGSKLLYTYE